MAAVKLLLALAATLAGVAVGQLGTFTVTIQDAGIAPSSAMITFQNTLILSDRGNFNDTGGHIRPLSPPLVLPNGVVNGVGDTVAEWQHTIEYDLATANSRPLRVASNTLGGAFLADGDGSAWLVSGSNAVGSTHIRSYDPCPFSPGSTCDFNNFVDGSNSVSTEGTTEIIHNRGTPVTLHDGQRLMVGGGTGDFDLSVSTTSFAEYFPRSVLNRRPWSLQILRDGAPYNQYPFVYILPSSCRMYVFSYFRSAIVDYCSQTEVQRFQDFPDRIAHNYPSTGTFIPRPLFAAENFTQVEIVVCGGSTPKPSTQAFTQAVFQTVLQNDLAVGICGRLNLGCWGRDLVCNRTLDFPSWTTFSMTTRRVMSDGILLASGDYLLINGAQRGHATFNSARIPNLTPEICSFDTNTCTAQGSTIYPRGYLSIAIQLPNATVLVGGGGTLADRYESDPLKAPIPTSRTLEIFTPPYLLTGAPKPAFSYATPTANYGKKFVIRFTLPLDGSGSPLPADLSRIQLNMYANPSVTHSLTFNQRLVKLVDPRTSIVTLNGGPTIVILNGVPSGGRQEYQLSVIMPKLTGMAPPMYYLTWVLYDGVPSIGIWIALTFGPGVI